MGHTISHTASESLAQLLMQNGAIDTTEKTYPEHHKLMQKEGYVPESIKRTFSFGKNFLVKFDYQTIYAIVHANCHVHKDKLSVDQLKSIIAFYNLPYSTRATFIDHGRNIGDLSKLYYEIIEDTIRDAFSKNIVTAFENVKI